MKKIIYVVLMFMFITTSLFAYTRRNDGGKGYFERSLETSRQMEEAGLKHEIKMEQLRAELHRLQEENRRKEAEARIRELKRRLEIERIKRELRRLENENG